MSDYSIALIPNLKFINDKLYFVSKYPIKITHKDIVQTKYELPIDIQLSDYILYNQKYINYTIQKDSLENGIKIHIYCESYEATKYAKLIHSYLLNIPFEDKKNNDKDNNDMNNSKKKNIDNEKYENNYYDNDNDYRNDNDNDNDYRNDNHYDNNCEYGYDDDTYN